MTSLTIRFINAGPQDNTTNRRVTSQCTAANQCHHEARVAKLARGDLKRKVGIENWVSLAICCFCDFRLQFLPRADFRDFYEVFWKRIIDVESVKATLVSEKTCLWNNRELKQPRWRRQQKPHKFAYLTMKNRIFARFARAFFIFWHFEDVVVLFTTWNDLFCSCVDDVSIWSQIINNSWRENNREGGLDMWSQLSWNSVNFCFEFL